VVDSPDDKDGDVVAGGLVGQHGRGGRGADVDGVAGADAVGQGREAGVERAVAALDEAVGVEQQPAAGREVRVRGAAGSPRIGAQRHVRRRVHEAGAAPAVDLQRWQVAGDGDLHGGVVGAEDGVDGGGDGAGFEELDFAVEAGQDVGGVVGFE